jgi:hypothetical protein
MFSGPYTLRLAGACLRAPSLTTSWFPQMGAIALTGPNEGGWRRRRIDLQGKGNSRAGSCRRTGYVPGSLRTDDAVAASHLRIATSRNENWLGAPLIGFSRAPREASSRGNWRLSLHTPSFVTRSARI